MTDATPLQTQADRLAEARKKQEQREQGIRAQAIKQGREAERNDILKALGVQRIEDASTSAQLRAERDARPTRDEELKHGRHRFYQGGLLGVCIGAMLASALIFAMQGMIWDTAARNFREQAMTGAILRAGEETLP